MLTAYVQGCGCTVLLYLVHSRLAVLSQMDTLLAHFLLVAQARHTLQV